MKLRKNSVNRVLRGGVYFSGRGLLLCTFRLRNLPQYRTVSDGFRFVVRG